MSQFKAFGTGILGSRILPYIFGTANLVISMWPDGSHPNFKLDLYGVSREQNSERISLLRAREFLLVCNMGTAS